MVILYEVHKGLYVNMTNKCPCSCTFCLRQTRNEMEGSGSLWLEREPTVEEVKAEFSKFDMDKYEEVVFCGFGEPTERLYDLLEVLLLLKKNTAKKHELIQTVLPTLSTARIRLRFLKEKSIPFQSASIHPISSVTTNLQEIVSV